MSTKRWVLAPTAEAQAQQETSSLKLKPALCSPITHRRTRMALVMGQDGTARTSETAISRRTATLRVRTWHCYLAASKHLREPWERAIAQQHTIPLASPISAMVPGAWRTLTLISVRQELLELLIYQQPDRTSQHWIALFTSILEKV